MNKKLITGIIIGVFLIGLISVSIAEDDWKQMAMDLLMANSNLVIQNTYLTALVENYQQNWMPKDDCSCGGGSSAPVSAPVEDDEEYDADVNGDGDVNDLDRMIIECNIGTSNPIADVNGDGIVDGGDYLTWQSQAEFSEINAEEYQKYQAGEYCE